MPAHPHLAPGGLPTRRGGTGLAALGTNMGSLAAGRSGGLMLLPTETPGQAGRDRPARGLASLSPWLSGGHVGRPEPDPVRTGMLEVTWEGQGLPEEGPARGTEGLRLRRPEVGT